MLALHELCHQLIVLLNVLIDSVTVGTTMLPRSGHLDLIWVDLPDLVRLLYRRGACLKACRLSCFSLRSFTSDWATSHVRLCR